MTRTISLITATVGAALLFAVPAWGDNWGADQSSQSVGYLNPDTADRAASAKQRHVTNMLDAREEALAVSVQNRVQPVDRERALGTKNELTLSSDFYADGFAQALSPRDSRPEPVRDDRFRLDPNSTPSVVTATSSGREIEWPTIGVGFGIGIVLLLGITLAMKATHTRPFAH
jgi:hypothetical protein